MTPPFNAKGSSFLTAAILAAFAVHALLYDLRFAVEVEDREDLAPSAGNDRAESELAETDGRRSLPVYRKPEPVKVDPWGMLPSLSRFLGDQRPEGPGYAFSVLLVSYHKTGHDLQMDLIDYIKYQFPGIGPKLTEYGTKSPMRRRQHPKKTPCTRVHLPAGSISVQHAPDFFCNPTDLAQLLVYGGDKQKAGKGRLGAVSHKGVKVVHLVRNPFEMAVSNYHYHAQVPSPEAWIHHQNPCDIEYHQDGITDNFADMVVPTLTKMGYSSMNVSFGEPLFAMEDFHNIRNDCLSLYQTREGLQEATLLDHLMNYDAPEGLRLATAEMTIQGFNNGGDILRMANNIVKLRQAQARVTEGPRYKKDRKELRIYTMSLDDFIAQPAQSAYRFFDFVMGARASQMQKEAVANQYEEYYRSKEIKSQHVTHGRSHNTEELKEYLRHDPVYGPPLTKIERLVETALATDDRSDGRGLTQRQL